MDKESLYSLIASGFQKGEDEVRIDYCQVSYTFPSEHPHSLYFDLKIIDGSRLKGWAVENGWVVKLEAAEKMGELPVVVFRMA